ncbi:uncharacterized protein JCM10292_001004 [Rhodotorula paludigena]|uniref:uncharacterized protein n=1 Tax=Rhodotorula paludigena TaxID=86838 RepID=UPI0031782090
MGFFSSDNKGSPEAQPAASSSSLYSAPPPPPAFAPPEHSDDKHAAAPPGYVAPPPNSSYAQKRPDAPQYAALHLAQSDRIRLIGFSLDCNHVVQSSWPREIQKQGKYDQVSYEFKLRGNPWAGWGAEAVPARRLLCHILAALASVGWHLAVSVDLSKKGYDKDTLLFRTGPPIQRYFFSVTFNEADKVRIIDPPNEEVKQAFIQAVHSWPRGVQLEKEKEFGCYQLKLRGYPWLTSVGAEVNHSRLLACRILGALDACGFELEGSVDMSTGGGDNGSMDLDSWFFASKM